MGFFCKISVTANQESGPFKEKDFIRVQNAGKVAEARLQMVDVGNQ